MYARTVVRRWLPVVAMAVVAGWTGLSPAQDKKPTPPKPKDIVEIAREVPELKTFCKLLDSAGLIETLKGEGPFTVFAPTNEAFAKLGKELDELQKPENYARLQRILKNHVLEGRTVSAELKVLKSIKTLAGDEIKITVTDHVISVGPAKVLKADVMAANGLTHQIDTVLIPAEKPEN